MHLALLPVLALLSAAAGQPTEGTAVVRGRVVDAVTGRPIARANVYFGARQRPPYGANQSTPPERTALTDAEGRFEVPALAAADYAVTASRTGGYLSGSYGTARAVSDGKLLIVAEGARIEIGIRLWPAASIAGHVFDERGRPVAGASVYAVTKAGQPGRSMRTDDRGAYEIADLAAGEYTVGVVVQVSNRVLRSSSRSEFGNYRPPLSPYLVDRGGRSVLSVYGAPIAPSAADGRPQTYTTTYFGGAPFKESASYFTLRAGESRAGVDLTLTAVRGSRVAGIATVPSGSVSGVILSLRPQGAEDTWTNGRMEASASSDGSFVFQAVPPGQYTLTAWRRAPPLTELEITDGALSMGHDDVIDRDPDDLWARTALAVGGDDIDGLAVPLTAGTAVTGRLALDEAATAALYRARFGLTLRPADDEDRLDDSRGFTVAADGSLSARVKPGRYLIGVRSNVGDLTFTGATLNGREIGDGPLVVGADPVTGLELTFSREPTSVAGTLRDGRGGAVEHAFVIAVPVDQDRWQRLETSSRGMLLEARDGRYRVSRLVPGEYYVVALETAISLRPENLRRVIGRATRVELRPGVPATANLVVYPDDER